MRRRGQRCRGHKGRRGQAPIARPETEQPRGQEPLWGLQRVRGPGLEKRHPRMLALHPQSHLILRGLVEVQPLFHTLQAAVDRVHTLVGDGIVTMQTGHL